MFILNIGGNKMKRILSIIIILVLGLFVFSGCQGQTLTGNAIKTPLEKDSEVHQLGKTDTNSEPKKIELEDISPHNSESDCWVAYDGKVYDITEFLGKHKSPLSKYCGTSTEFEEAYMGKHKGYKDDILNQFQIGILN